MRRRFIDALPLLSPSSHLGEGGDILTGQMSSEAPFRSPITKGGTLPAEFWANCKADTEPRRAVSPVSLGFTVNCSSGFVRASDSDWPLLPLSNFSSSQPENTANPPSSGSGTFGIFRSSGVDFQRHILIGASGPSAFSERSRKQTTSVIGSAGLRLPAEAVERGARSAIPRRLLRGRRGAGRCKAGWGRKEAEDE